MQHEANPSAKGGNAITRTMLAHFRELFDTEGTCTMFSNENKSKQ